VLTSSRVHVHSPLPSVVVMKLKYPARIPSIPLAAPRRGNNLAAVEQSGASMRPSGLHI
jgi:hypothetical protein